MSLSNLIRVLSPGIVLALVGACQNLVSAPPAPTNPTQLTHLEAMHNLLIQARNSAEDATDAASVIALKHYVDEVYAVIWDSSSGLASNTGAAQQPGWRDRWQADYRSFDSEFAARYHDGQVHKPAAELGLVGHGRLIRRSLSEHPDIVSALNNVIGWQRLDDGVTKGERQPRIDLTYRWDAEQSFWLSEADTGWIFLVQAQAINILKTDYGEDLPLARQHAEDLKQLIEQCLTGADEQPGLTQALSITRQRAPNQESES